MRGDAAAALPSVCLALCRHAYELGPYSTIFQYESLRITLPLRNV